MEAKGGFDAGLVRCPATGRTASEASGDSLSARLAAIDAAVEHALASPLPGLAELTTDVYGEAA